MRSIGVAAALAVVLAGCVTTGLDTPEAKKYAHIVGSSCVVSSSVDGDVRSQKQFHENVIINSFDYGRDGWVRIDATSSGVRDNVYFNESQRKVVCGGRNWTKAHMVFTKVSAEEFAARK